jgi:hypothetical protein
MIFTVQENISRWLDVPENDMLGIDYIILDLISLENARRCGIIITTT